MNSVEAIVSAVLYEGYMLYPYRASSVKNRQRWTLGGLCPPAYAAVHDDERCTLKIECLVEGGPDTTIGVDVGFLQPIERRVRALDAPAMTWPPPGDAIGARDVDTLDVDGVRHCAWQEAAERRVALPRAAIGDLCCAPLTVPFAFDGGTAAEPLRNRAGDVVGMLVRVQQPLTAHARIACTPVDADAFRLTVDVCNATPMPSADIARNAAMASALVSCHAVLRVGDGAFVSLLEPPERLRDATAACRNAGAWPVLVGGEGARDAMLASPIILYDYPEVAPESAGELFDGTEIDEILTLRILTMTDAEKREMAATDERSRALLERTERLTPEQMQAMHGTLRTVRPLDALAHDDLRTPHIEFWREGGYALRVGERVRLRPRGNADIMDLALAGMLATIESIERDFDNRIHVAVTIDEDPGRDLGLARMPGHRFFFAPGEVESVEREATR